MNTQKLRNTRALIYPLAVFFAIALYNFLYAYSYFSITEGWFSEYAKLIRNGQTPYSDFHLLLPPLYPAILACFQAIFGDDFFPLRILGVVITSLIALILYHIAKSLIGRPSAALFAIISTIYYQSGNAYFGYDFTQFLTLFLLCGAGAFFSAVRQRIVNENSDRNILIKLFLGGMFFSLAILIKQSNASLAVAIFAIVLTLVGLRTLKSRELGRYFAISFSGFALPFAIMIIWLMAHGALDKFFNDVFFNAMSAKGGRGEIFTGWMKGFFLPLQSYTFWSIQFLKYLGILVGTSATLALPVLGWQLIKTRKEKGEQWNWKFYLQSIFTSTYQCSLSTRHQALLVFALPTALILNIYFKLYVGWAWMKPIYDKANGILILGAVNIYIVGIIASIVAVLIRPNARNAQWCLLFALGCGLVMGNGTSAGLSEISAFLGYGLLLSFLFRAALPFGITTLPIVIVCISITSVLADNRYATPYHWWAVKSADIRDASCARLGGIFNHICVSQDNKDKLLRVVSFIKNRSTPEDSIYVYPHMPLFYLMTNRTPYDGAVVSWFDFMSDQEAIALAKSLVTHPPRVIIFADLPDLVIQTHERLFRGGKPAGQRKILQAVAELESRGIMCVDGKVNDLQSINILLISSCTHASQNAEKTHAPMKQPSEAGAPQLP